MHEISFVQIIPVFDPVDRSKGGMREEEPYHAFISSLSTCLTEYTCSASAAQRLTPKGDNAPVKIKWIPKQKSRGVCVFVQGPIVRAQMAATII